MDTRDRQGRTALTIAAANNQLAAVASLLAHGASETAQDLEGNTALIAAARAGHVEALRELLLARADVNQVNRLGRSALAEAVVRGDGGPRFIEIARMLLARGASVEQFDAGGLLPLRHAELRGQVQMAELLRRAAWADKPSTLER